MRAILLSAILIGATAVADDSADFNVNRIEEKSGLAESDEPTDARTTGSESGTRAQDYNSSRSNNSSAVEVDDSGDDDADDEKPADSGDESSQQKRAAPAAPANHNTTRSNRT